MSLNRPVALYCYEFAPQYKVGGRRWRLFAPRLAEDGLQILLRAKAPSQEVKLDGIHDVAWFNRPRGWIYPWSDSWAWRSLRIWRIQEFLAGLWLKGNSHDETIFLQPWIKRQVRHDLMVLGVKTFVVSCPAFHWAHTIAKEIARHDDPEVRRCLAGGRNISFHTLRNGVEIPDAPKRNHNRDRKTIQLLFAGWVYPPGQPLLVSFLEKLARKHRASLTIAGDWPPELIRQIREWVEVVELGYLPHESIEKLLKTHDFALSFVAPEVNDAINTKILEAAAQRTPVVVSWWENEREPGPWTTFEVHHDLDRLAEEMFEILVGQSS